MNQRDSSDIEIDEGIRTQLAMVQVERVGRVVMAVAVLAALFGLLGDSGPLNSREQRSEAVTITHDRFARIDAVTEIGVLMDINGSSPRVVVSDSYLDGVMLEKVHPEPRSVVAVDGGTAFNFERDGDRALLVRFFVNAPSPGSLSGTVTVGGDTFPISQLVYP